MIWISKHGKNITIYNYYMECIKKLCSKHPDEVLIRTDFMWQMILQAMFKLTNEKSLRKKRFCKTFFKEKMKNEYMCQVTEQLEDLQKKKDEKSFLIQTK